MATESEQFLEKVLFISHLLDVNPLKVAVFLRGAEPVFNRECWFADTSSLAFARLGLTPDGESREPISASNPSVAANWYHLCDSPREVLALYYQLGFEQLAIWRLAHMWEELQ
ncbi:MAG: hypothetical protein KBC02_04070 [Candidatus Pacebacteria bacterium]|nr:hypothetical protein [Candidatus Paceibacterota bacterium]